MEKYIQFDSILLSEVQEYFTKTVYRHLIEKYNIVTLGDFFRQTDNGVLFTKITKNITSKFERNDLCMVINGTVNILKYKYLNINLKINDNSSLDEFYEILGISFWDKLKLSECGIYKFNQLMEMAEKNNFSQLYSCMQWRKEKINVIINKIYLIYNLSITNEKIVRDYSMFRDIHLKDFSFLFGETIVNNLINLYNINSLEDLFVMNDSGKLYEMLWNSNNNSRFSTGNLCTVLSGTISLLKYKYLNLPIAIDDNELIDDVSIKLGLLYTDRMNLFLRGISRFEQLKEMVENNDFSVLTYGKRNQISETTINKIKLFYDLHYKNNIQCQKKSKKENYSYQLEKLKKELHLLYIQLAQCINEQNENNVRDVEKKIENLLVKKICLEKSF